MRAATTQTNHIENGSLLRQKKNLTDNKSGQVELKGFSSRLIFKSEWTLPGGQNDGNIICYSFTCLTD